MNNNEIVNINYKDIKELCKTIVGRNTHYLDDLLQEVLLILLEMNSDKLLAIHNDNDKGVIRFTYRIITNQFNSKTSTFYRKYKKYNNNKVMDMSIIDTLLDLEDSTQLTNFTHYNDYE